MSQLTLIPMQENKYPKNAKQRAEYEREIAEEIASNFDQYEAQAFIEQKDHRAARVSMRLPNTVSPEWLDAFNNQQSIARIARHLAKRCKFILAA